MKYRDVEDYLDSLSNYELTGAAVPGTTGLERVGGLLAQLGDPHRTLKTIHIAGTKGKGSTCAFLFSILKEAGYKVGLFTSPHLVRCRERIKVSYPDSMGESLERMIEEQEMCWLLEELKPYFDQSPGLTYFEAITVMALKFFANVGMDFVIMETGMGGRLDATNVVTPLIAGISPISMDHTAALGETLDQIAAEKTAIIKENAFVVSASQSPEAFRVLEQTVQQKKARLYTVGKDFVTDVIGSNLDGSSFDFRGTFESYEDLHIPLLGMHQIGNCALALGIIQVLRLHDVFVSLLAIKRGLMKTRWPGRMQLIRRRPYLVLDGAHNEASAQALQHALRQLFVAKKTILILGISRDKDVAVIADQLLRGKQLIFLTQSSHARAMDVDMLEQRLPAPLKESGIVRKFLRVQDALQEAARESGPDDLIVLTGSLYLVGEAFKELQTIVFPDYEKKDSE